MAFDPVYSSDNIWVGDNVELCLTDHLDDIETDIAGKADIIHTHTGYAASEHTHSYNSLTDKPISFPANGGNADTVDGKHASDFVSSEDIESLQNLVGDTAVSAQISNAINGITPSSIGAAASEHGTHVPDACKSISDWNNATTTGWYMGLDAINAPSTGAKWYFGHVIAHNANYLIQEVYQFTASNDAAFIPKYVRARHNGNWGSWREVTVSRTVPSNAVLNPDDYVILSGYSGQWEFRKWNNGVYECWRKITGTITNSGSWNGFKIFSGTAEWPSGVFIANPTVFFNCYIGSGYAIASRGGLSTTTNFNWSALGTDGDSNVGYCIHVYAIGRWK